MLHALQEFAPRRDSAPRHLLKAFAAFIMAGTAEAEPCAAAAAAVKVELDVEGLPAQPLRGDALRQAEVPAVLDAVEVKAEQTKLKIATRGSVEDVKTEIEPEGQQTGETSDYELQRLRNIARNQRQLEALVGL